ncbi:MAG: zf-HC2 domain-containing protein [Chloroflexi bacterium]|nr:zf-HC2 domain-containing protein [Chloroflexota bacterium]MCI0578706.1 zf-HC2 domain-containing protein [Chloroflexota bacterium]MCI0648366.1 zf-HC2 domain-containing protein [Chloroflexota bacterium]
MDQTHILHLIPDYVLELLSDDKRQIVDGHLARCPQCRLAVQEERQVGHLVRATLTLATRPEAAHLRRLMPAAPTRRAALPGAWSKQLATACLLLLLILGSVGLTANDRPQLWPGPGPALFTSTATATDQPTLTVTLTAANYLAAPTAVPGSRPQPVVLPHPAATPAPATLLEKANE